MKPDFSKYIDIPFKPRGRNFDGCDCYGLLRLIYEQELGIFLPDYLDVNYSCDVYKYKETYLQDGWEEQMKGEWKPTRPPYKLWDGLLFYANPKKIIADHIGLYIGNGKFIHTSAYYKTSMVSKLEGTWESKLYGGARYIGKS